MTCADATRGDATPAARLAVEAADAARIRALATDPDVIALRVERIRGQVDACAWLAIGLGLAFTAVNVQTFAAAGAAVWSPAWLVAWLLDPMVSLLLIAVLRAEQVTARWQVPTGPRVAAAKWGAFTATYAMNTWAAWTSGVPSGVVLHSVPPLVVLLGAEVAPELRDRLTAAVHAAAAAPSVGRLPAARTGQVRTAALAARPTVADVAGNAGTEDAVTDRESGGDARVRELVELLAAGCPVTGPQAAALHEVSERQGRRLLADARADRDTDTPANPTVTGTTTVPRPGLQLVDLLTAGGHSS